MTSRACKFSHRLGTSSIISLRHRFRSKQSSLSYRRNLMTRGKRVKSAFSEERDGLQKARTLKHEGINHRTRQRGNPSDGSMFYTLLPIARCLKEITWLIVISLPISTFELPSDRDKKTLLSRILSDGPNPYSTPRLVTGHAREHLFSIKGPTVFTLFRKVLICTYTQCSRLCFPFSGRYCSWVYQGHKSTVTRRIHRSPFGRRVPFQRLPRVASPAFVLLAATRG